MTDWSFLAYAAIGLGSAVLAAGLVSVIVWLDTRHQQGRR
jgi:hypothetical protein